MKFILVRLLIFGFIVREISGDYYEDQVRNTFNKHKITLEDYFNSLQSSLQQTIGNHDKEKVDSALRASKACRDQIANSTQNTELLEKSMQTKLDQLEKKLQNTLDQVLHTNETCNCRISSLENFEKIGNKFYRFENKLKSDWFTANERCQELGAHLSSLQNENELELLQTYLGETDYWLGINDLDIPDEYRVSITGQRATLLLWDVGEPQISDGNSHCVKLQRDGFDYVMGLQRCSLQYNFICEKILFEDCQGTNEGC